jgi:hypothetical protein
MVNSNGMRHMLGKFTLLAIYVGKSSDGDDLYFGATLNENLILSDV